MAIDDDLRTPLPSICGWCNRASNLERRYGPERLAQPSINWVWGALYVCPACGMASLIIAVSQHPDGSGASRLEERMPLASKPDMEGVPPPVSTDRAEGWRAFHGALYKSAALLARSALEAATRNLGAKGDNLRSRIHALAESGVITTKLAEWADEVRVTGNEAAHEMETVSEEDADAALYFLDSFLDDVYVVPYRQEERRLARERRELERQEEPEP